MALANVADLVTRTQHGSRSEYEWADDEAIPIASALTWLDFLSSTQLTLALSEARRLVRCSGGGCTHFIDSSETPSCVLEQLALDVIGS